MLADGPAEPEAILHRFTLAASARGAALLGGIAGGIWTNAGKQLQSPQAHLLLLPP